MRKAKKFDKEFYRCIKWLEAEKTVNEKCAKVENIGFYLILFLIGCMVLFPLLLMVMGKT